MADLKSMFFEISIDGKVLDAERRALVSEVVFEDAMSGADSLIIKVNDPDYLFIEDSLFVKDKKISFKGGWDDDRSLAFQGYISLIDIDYPETGSPVMIITCMDNTHIMNREKKKRTWSNTKVSTVVTQIFKEYGFKADVDATTTVEETISQSNMTDIDFIIDLASKEKEDYTAYVEVDKAYFKKVKLLASPQMVLYYREGNFDIKSFSPRINKEILQEKITASNVNDKTKKVVTSTANKDTPKDTQGSSPQSGYIYDGTGWERTTW